MSETCKQMTLWSDVGGLNSSLAGFLANLTRLRGEDLDWPMSGTYGPSISNSSKESNPIGLLVRMSLESEIRQLTSLSVTWNPQATPSGRLFWQARPQGFHSIASVFGFWPAPTVVNPFHRGRQLIRRGVTWATIDSQGRKWGASLRDVVFRVHLSNSESGNIPASISRFWMCEMAGMPHDWTDLPTSKLSELSATATRPK